MKNIFLKAFIVFLFVCGIIILATQRKEIKVDNVEIKGNTNEIGNTTGVRFSDTEIDGSLL